MSTDLQYSEADWQYATTGIEYLHSCGWREIAITDREVTFKLRNSSKTVRNFGWRSNYESYATGCETGCNILPGSSFEQKISSPRYDYYVCAGVKKEKLLVDFVFFNDGSSWEPKAHSFGKKDTGTR